MKAFILSIKIFVLLTILTGIIYPLVVTGIVQLIFPARANGSIIIKNNSIVGSKLIGQKFDSAIFFHSRPSVTDYSLLPSSGSNLGLTNALLKKQFEQRKKQFITENFLTDSTEIPADMLTNSASGIDPHISYRAAILQVNRIAKARKFNENQKIQLLQAIKLHTEPPQFLCLGDERVNVLLLNLDLEKIR